jgi:hypothetical protein
MILGKEARLNPVAENTFSRHESHVAERGAFPYLFPLLDRQYIRQSTEVFWASSTLQLFDLRTYLRDLRTGSWLTDGW